MANRPITEDSKVPIQICLPVSTIKLFEQQNVYEDSIHSQVRREFCTYTFLYTGKQVGQQTHQVRRLGSAR